MTRDIGPKTNALESTMTSRLRHFVKMNPPIFVGSKVGESPQEFLEVYSLIVHHVEEFINLRQGK